MDIWAKSYDDYSLSPFYNVSRDYTEYCEDIFWGYRYFEKIPGAKNKVIYPFGYGLSYTNFEISSSYCLLDGIIRVNSKVKNMGNVSGKEMIQVYTSSPDGKLDKPAKELRAYNKTPLLAPGEECEIEMCYKSVDMASYDERKAAWVLEEGSCDILVGNSVEDTEKICSINYDYTVIKQVDNLCVPEKLTKRMHSDGTFEVLTIGEYDTLEDTSDWGSCAEPYFEILAGNNVYMPVSNCEHLCKALEKGHIPKEQLKGNAKTVLNFIMRLA